MRILKLLMANPVTLRSKSKNGHVPLTLIVARDAAHAWKTVLLFSKLWFDFQTQPVELPVRSPGSCASK
jgi:hypothetical protein